MGNFQAGIGIFISWYFSDVQTVAALSPLVLKWPEVVSSSSVSRSKTLSVALPALGGRPLPQHWWRNMDVACCATNAGSLATAVGGAQARYSLWAYNCCTGGGVNPNNTIQTQERKASGAEIGGRRCSGGRFSRNGYGSRHTASVQVARGMAKASHRCRDLPRRGFRGGGPVMIF